MSKPLEEILNSLTPGERQDGGKRRSPGGEDTVACAKRPRAEDPEGAAASAGDVGLGLSGGASREADSGAAAPLQGEGSSCHTDLDTGVLPPPPQPSDPSRDADKMEAGNGAGFAPLSDGVSAAVGEARPAVGQAAPLPIDGVTTGTRKEPEVRPTVEVRPVVEQEVSLPEGQAARLESEIEADFPMEELKERLTEEPKVGPMVEEEVRPTAELKAFPQEQVNLTEELKVGPMVEEEVRPTAELKAFPQEQVNLTEELKVGPTVEEEVRPTVEEEGDPVGMVAAPSHLFWKNEKNLCWLDALLVALVNCRTLRKRAASLLKNKSPIQRLCNRYSQACDLLKANKQMGPQG